VSSANAHRSTAEALYRDMEMPFGLDQARL
jgi:hypothetical protein